MRRLLTLCLVGVAGCGAKYYYEPAEQATARVAGYPAARYAEPPERPTGDVRVATFGIVDVDVGAEDRVPSLHVRLVVSKEGGTAPWTLDTREIRVHLANRAPITPSFTSSSADGLPSIQVAPGQKLTVDAFFPLPADLRRARDLPHFDVSWVIETEARRIAERTPFERIRIEPYPEPGFYYGRYGYGYGPGFAPYWWYDPVYAYPVPIRHPPRIYRIHRP